MRAIATRFGVIMIILSLIFVAGVGAEEVAALPFMNASLSPEQRAIDLVHRMTLQEKASQLVNQARAIPRLGVPAYDWWSEALHGVIGKGTTEFLQPIGLAATFNVPEGGAAIARTLSGKNNPAGRLPVTFYKDVSQLPPSKTTR
jgi:beta-glucosidase